MEKYKFCWDKSLPCDYHQHGTNKKAYSVQLLVNSENVFVSAYTLVWSCCLRIELRLFWDSLVLYGQTYRGQINLDMIHVPIFNQLLTSSTFNRVDILYHGKTYVWMSLETKNKTRLLQYMPNKHHHKWGIKLWMLCESASAYVLACFVYRGKAEHPDPNDQRGLGTGL